MEDLKCQHLPVNAFKLSALFLFFLFSLIAIPLLLNFFLFHFNCLLPIICGLLPFFLLIGCALFNSQEGKFSDRFAYIKYYKWSPVFFYYDKDSYECRFKKYQDLLDVVQPGDILLRRYDNYIDGLILAQNSYFTHAAIYKGNKEVIQALGNGVGSECLEDFSHCDDIAVLRFNYEKIDNFRSKGPIRTSMLWGKIGGNPFKDSPRIPEYLLRSLSDTPSPLDIILNHPQDKVAVEKIIKDTLEASSSEARAVHEKTLRWYKEIYDQVRKSEPLKNIKITKDECIKLVLEICNSFIGRKYDMLFSFSDTRKVSCVELAWYSHVFLFSFHQIVRAKERFFSVVATKIVLPDFFIASEWFDLVYSGNENINNEKDNLKKFADCHHLNFWRHFVYMLLAQLILSFITLSFIWAIKKIV